MQPVELFLLSSSPPPHLLETAVTSSAPQGSSYREQLQQVFHSHSIPRQAPGYNGVHIYADSNKPIIALVFSPILSLLLGIIIGPPAPPPNIEAKEIGQSHDPYVNKRWVVPM